ncbi:MAG TPA: hypothetical protein PK544_06980 [Spirochaetota bacterium]|nr:hypothetical protein [Spirochaetota bacterium]HPJ38045.1 hypothetical protein [Spirochaetota bacterium]HPQ52433.1 hypothetical protein [Spirochaetota bacterium]
MLNKPNMLYNRFVMLVEEHHQEITERFMNDLLHNPETPAYRNLDRNDIYEHSDRVFRDLSRWITRDFPKSKIEERYKKLGRDRFSQGVPFSQVQKALVLQKRHLWLFVMDKLYSDLTSYKEAIDLNNRVVLYFDRATFYMLEGHEEKLHKGL